MEILIVLQLMEINNILFRGASKNLNIISDNNIALFVNNKEMKLNNSENKPSIFSPENILKNTLSKNIYIIYIILSKRND